MNHRPSFPPPYRSRACPLKASSLPLRPFTRILSRAVGTTHVYHGLRSRVVSRKLTPSPLASRTLSYHTHAQTLPFSPLFPGGLRITSHVSRPQSTVARVLISGASLGFHVSSYFPSCPNSHADPEDATPQFNSIPEREHRVGFVPAVSVPTFVST